MNLLAEIPITIPAEEVQVAPTLDLEILDAPASSTAQGSASSASFKYYLKKGHQFKINARGLIDSKRNKHDGCVFFGSSPQFKNEGVLFSTSSKKEILNDVVLGENLDKNPGNYVLEKRHFIIRYRLDTKGYYLKDTGEGLGTFVRVDRPLVIFFSF